MPSEPTPKWGSQIRRIRSAVSSQGSASRSTIDVVVAERLPLLEPHRRRGYPRSSAATISAATSASLAPAAVDHASTPSILPHPGQLAAGEAPLGALHRLDVAGEQLLEADRRARRPRGARRVGAARPPPRRPAGPSRRPGRRSAPASSSRSIVRPTSSRRMAQPLASTARRRVACGAIPSRCELGQPRDPLAVVGVHAARRARASSSACSASGPALGELAPRPRARTSDGHRRAQLELGERRAHVEAGAADDDRAPALGEQRVDLGVGERRRSARRENSSSIGTTPSSRCSSRARSLGVGARR